MTTTANVPNLDAMEFSDLMDFWNRHQSGRGYRDLFPDGGGGSKSAAGDLASYAANKATAIDCRRRGDIHEAQGYERIADQIYRRLPAFARW